MSKLSEFISLQKQDNAPAAGMEVDISGNCSICFVDVDEATYFPEYKLLKYVCPRGHASYLEDFNL